VIEASALTSAQDFVRRLQPRERKLLALAGGAIALMIVLTAAIQVHRRMERLRSEIANGGHRLEQVHALIVQFEQKKALLNDVAPGPQGPGGQSLQVVVQEIINQAGAGDSVVSIRNRPVPPGDAEYRETAVEIQLKALAQEPLVKLLVGIDRSPQRLKVSRLQLDAHGDEGKRLFDVAVAVSRFEPATGDAR